MLLGKCRYALPFFRLFRARILGLSSSAGGPENRAGEFESKVSREGSKTRGTGLPLGFTQIAAIVLVSLVSAK